MATLFVPVSYMGSGSSAFTDLLAESRLVRAPRGSFEYVFLHAPGGLFDLEDKLLVGNNALRSDEALHSFLERMRSFYSGRWWVGHYDQNLSPRFLERCEAFVEELTEEKPDFYWYEQERYPKSSYPYLALRGLLRRLSGGRLELSRPLTHKPMRLAWPTAEEFYAASRHFLQQVFTDFAEALGEGSPILVPDQLLLPHNLHRVPHYFPEGLEALVIRRDPRDVFLSNKYVWAKNGEPVPYPTDAEAFCRMYGRLRRAERPCENEHIHIFWFEDLVYRYEETRARVGELLEQSRGDSKLPLWGEPKTHFDPARSIANTQLWITHPEWEPEARRIAEALPEYCYTFPCPPPATAGSIF